MIRISIDAPGWSSTGGPQVSTAELYEVLNAMDDVYEDAIASLAATPDRADGESQ